MAPVRVRPTRADRAEQVNACLATVMDPELDESVTELGFITELELGEEGDVRIGFRLPTYWCAANFAFLMADDMRSAVQALPWVTRVQVHLYEHMYAEAINQGVTEGAGFQAAFGAAAEGGLDGLRRTFLLKAFQSRQLALLLLPKNCTMPSDCITYQDSGYFIPLMNDYLNQKPELASLYHRFPTVENFEKQYAEKQAHFTDAHRNVLVTALKKQYAAVETSSKTAQNIDALLQSNTFTITTGHQLNLFTGPLYFLYKIVSTINLTKDLKAKYPKQNFVPIYWMATEDHDFEEINNFNFKGKKIRWNADNSGPVGRYSTQGLEEIFKVFEREIGSNINAQFIKNLFEASYVRQESLTAATRYLANVLFGETGLVILDADDATLKKEFAPFVKEELLHQTSYKHVTATIQKLKPYDIQVNPREINLFYIEDHLRERIILENGKYKINHTSLEFSEAEISALVEQHPEKFSPNVMLRPLYQEVILPNLCYIGGGGELAYWLELKSLFDTVKVPFPILLLRNSALIATQKQADKADKLGLTWKDFFSKQPDLINRKATLFSEFPIDLSIQKDHLRNQFHYLHVLANQTDKSFSGAVKAQEAKQIKGLDHLEKRLLKAQKRKYQQELERIIDLQNELFPNGGLQERQANFSEFYIENGNSLIEKMLNELNPLKHQFSILVY